MQNDLVDADRKLVVKRFEGNVTGADIESWVVELTARDDFAADYSGVIDFREAKLDMSMDDLQSIVDLAAARRVTGRWAYLVTQPIETALAFTYQHLAAPIHPAAYFSTLRGASEYLGHDLLDFFPDDGLF